MHSRTRSPTVETEEGDEEHDETDEEETDEEHDETDEEETEEEHEDAHESESDHEDVPDSRGPPPRKEGRGSEVVATIGIGGSQTAKRGCGGCMVM